jgi:hypothetical protein
MTRVPFWAVVVALTAAGALIAALLAPGRLAVTAGVALGMGVAGAFAAVALAILRRLKGTGDSHATSKMVNAYLGLMLARMLGYLASIGAVVVLKVVDPLGFCAGLIAGTIVFQVVEVVYIRKMS